MLNEPTLEKLHALRLAAMAGAWTEQTKNPKMADLAFDERFGMLVDAEHLARDNRRLGRLLKDAQLRLPNACIEDIEASPTRGIDKPSSASSAPEGGSATTSTSCSVDRPASARVSSAARSGRAPAVEAIASSTAVCRDCSTNSPSHAPRAATRAFSLASRRWTSSCSTTGGSGP